MAREHYLTIDGSSRRQTMEKLAGLYRVTRNGTKGCGGSEKNAVILKFDSEEAAALKNLLQALSETDSGTNSGTNVIPPGGNPGGISASENLAERAGFERHSIL